MTFQNFDDLTALDAAPAAPLTADERIRSEQLLNSILASSITAEAATPPRRTAARTRGWRIAAYGLAAAVLVGGAVVVVPRLIHATTVPTASGPLTTVELAAWTGTPKVLTPTDAAAQPAIAWCLNKMTTAPGAGATPSIGNLDQRGDITSMIITRAGYTMLCISGPNSTGFWELDGDPATPVSPIAATAVTVESAGSHGDGPTGFTYVEGRVGANVKSITVTDAGRTFSAVIANGLWTAWWPTTDPHGEITGTVTIGTTDGSSRTVSGVSLEH